MPSTVKITLVENQMLFIFIGGASASGKTELGEKLIVDLEENGIRAKNISMDNYYKCFEDRYRREEPDNMDVPDAYDIELLHTHLAQLERGEIIKQPSYDFAKGRSNVTTPLDPQNFDVIVIEGILALHDVEKLKLVSKMAVFVESDDYLQYLERRCERDDDVNTRNTTPEETRRRELKDGVRDSFFRYIRPTQQVANYTATNNDIRLANDFSVNFKKIACKFRYKDHAITHENPNPYPRSN